MNLNILCLNKTYSIASGILEQLSYVTGFGRGGGRDAGRPFHGGGGRK